MSDNLPTNVQLDTNQNGSVSFATEVIATIAGLAATEVEGVASMYGGSAGFADILSRRGQSAKNLTKGVKVELAEGKLSVAVSIIVDYGSPVPEVALSIQENIKKAIETMSGLRVSNVDVHVQGVSFEREQRAAAEIEQQQRILLQRQTQEVGIGGEKAPDSDAGDAETDAAPYEPEIDPEDSEYELFLEDEEENGGQFTPLEDEEEEHDGEPE